MRTTSLRHHLRLSTQSPAKAGKEFIVITLPLSFRSDDEVLAAYRAAGGIVCGTPITETLVTCSGAPQSPIHTNWFTWDVDSQLSNLFKGILDIREVVAVQTPQQKKGDALLDDIEHDLARYSLVGAHAATWFLLPENMHAFREICPTGHLVFLEKFRHTDRTTRVLVLYLSDGSVHAISSPALEDRPAYGARYHFAVRKPKT